MIIRVEPEKCTGCRACEIFCPVEQEGQANPARSRIRVLKDEARDFFLPVVCPPCNDKACMSACPEPGAMAVDAKTGAVAIVDSRCTGCSKCIGACDLGAIWFLRETGRGKLGKAVVVKCNQCGGDPWCVKVCEPRALEYVDAPEGQAVFTTLRASLAEAETGLLERGAIPRRRIGKR